MKIITIKFKDGSKAKGTVPAACMKTFPNGSKQGMAICNGVSYKVIKRDPKSTIFTAIK